MATGSGWTVAGWFDAWERYFPDDRSPTTAKHDAYMLRDFASAYGRLALAEVNPLMAQKWALGHPSQVRYLRYVWDKALAMQLVTVNPWRLVQMPKRTEPPRGVPSLEQLDAAIDLARSRDGWWPEFADLVEFTAFTGARLGGVAGLTRGAVDVERRRAVLLEKGDRRRTVVLTGRALAAAACSLDRRSWAGPGCRVWRSPRRRPLTADSIGKAWREIRGDFDGPFHSLRHFAGTWLAGQGVDERDIAIQLGHFDRAGRPYTHLVRRVYVHPDHSDALARIERATATDGRYEPA
jgi:integrase